MSPPTEFKREERYIVLKIKDVEAALSHRQLLSLYGLTYAVDQKRKADGKPPLNCVVVESDWPMYESTWAAIEARVSGNATPLLQDVNHLHAPSHSASETCPHCIAAAPRSGTLRIVEPLGGYALELNGVTVSTHHKRGPIEELKYRLSCALAAPAAPSASAKLTDPEIFDAAKACGFERRDTGQWRGPARDGWIISDAMILGLVRQCLTVGATRAPPAARRPLGTDDEALLQPCPHCDKPIEVGADRVARKSAFIAAMQADDPWETGELGRSLEHAELAPGSEPMPESEHLSDVMALLRRAADHIDGITGARDRPESDSGELVAEIDQILASPALKVSVTPPEAWEPDLRTLEVLARAIKKVAPNLADQLKLNEVAEGLAARRALGD